MLEEDKSVINDMYVQDECVIAGRCVIGVLWVTGVWQ